MQDTNIDEMARRSPEKSASEIVAMLNDAARRVGNSGKITIAANLRALASQINGSGRLPEAAAVEAVITAAEQAPAAIVQTAIAESLPLETETAYQKIAYVPQDGELTLALAAIRAGEHPLFTGGAGCGKTHLAHHIAKVLKRPLYTLQGADGVVPEYIIGYRDPVSDGKGGLETVYRYGVAAQAAKDPRGAVLYWDEPNATPDGIRFWLFSLMDGRREITLPDNNGEVIRAGENFTVIGAMNEGKGYSGTSRLNDAQRERFAVIDLGYLPAARERKLLVQRTKCTEDTADKLVSLGRQLRASFERGEVHTPFGTRTLLKAAKLIVQNVKPLDAVKVAFVNAIPATNPPERKAVQTAAAAFFGKNATTEAAKEVQP